MPITHTAWRNYQRLKGYSENGRYDGIADITLHDAMMESDYNDALKRFTEFKQYIGDRGVAV